MIWGVSALLENSVPSPKQPQFSPASAHGSEGGAAGWNIPRLFWGTFKGRNMTLRERLVNKVLRQEPGEYCGVYSILLTITVAIWFEGPPCPSKTVCTGTRLKWKQENEKCCVSLKDCWHLLVESFCPFIKVCADFPKQPVHRSLAFETRAVFVLLSFSVEHRGCHCIGLHCLGLAPCALGVSQTTGGIKWNLTMSWGFFLFTLELINLKLSKTFFFFPQRKRAVLHQTRYVELFIVVDKEKVGVVCGFPFFFLLRRGPGKPSGFITPKWIVEKHLTLYPGCATMLP